MTRGRPQDGQRVPVSNVAKHSRHKAGMEQEYASMQGTTIAVKGRSGVQNPTQRS